MAKEARVTRKDIEKGSKRVNMQFTIKEFDALNLCAEYMNVPPSTLAKSFVLAATYPKIKEIDRSGYVSKSMRGENIFGRKGKRK